MRVRGENAFYEKAQAKQEINRFKFSFQQERRPVECRVNVSLLKREEVSREKAAREEETTNEERESDTVAFDAREDTRRQ